MTFAAVLVVAAAVTKYLTAHYAVVQRCVGDRWRYGDAKVTKDIAVIVAMLVSH